MCRYQRTFSNLRKNPRFLFVTGLKVPGETTKGLHLALFLFLEPRKNIGKSLKKEKNSAFSKVREGTQISTQKMISTEKNFLVERNVLGNLPFEFFHPAINFPSVKIFRFQIRICSVSIFGAKKNIGKSLKELCQPTFQFKKVGC